MVFIIAGLLLLWLGATTLRQFMRASPAAMARAMKRGGGFVALLLALFMLVRGEVGVAIFLAGLGFWLTRGARSPDWGAIGAGFSRGRTRRVSRVRSKLIEMELDHDTGVMRGGVLGGVYSGRGLGDLAQPELGILHRLCLVDDPEGARLLEAYFDRRFPGWREAHESEADAGRAGDAGAARARPGGGMSEEEAYKLLGLAQGASRDEIARAHRALMKKFHPDRGGSTDMAARVNEAKDVLMRRHP